MKYYKIIAATCLLVFISSCGNNEKKVEQVLKSKEGIREELLKSVKSEESEMHKSPVLDLAIAGVAIKAYSDFATMFPDDSLTPDFVFKSAEIETATQQYKQALASYETIENNYSDYKLYPESLFLKASLLDNYLNDDNKAKIAYEKVIEKFPTSSYATDAKAAILNLGKTDADLHKEFIKKNKEK